MATKMVLCWCLILFVPYLLPSQAQSPSPNVTVGVTITAGTNSSYWLSPSGDFAFGFRELVNGRYLIGIWFDKIPEKTFIWSPSRDRPAPKGSSVNLTVSGTLAATYSDGQSFQINQGAAANSAFMQDDGNFVLKDAFSNVVWESFKQSPTDTILPGQILVAGQKLYSNANGTVDYSTGRFMLEMQTDGKLVLSAYHFKDPGYWLIATVNNVNVSLVFNRSGSMYLRNTTNIIQHLTLNVSATPVEDYYHRATIDDYGNFQQYVYRKGSNGPWKQVWKAIREPCIVNAICGVYGICSSPDNQTVNCRCLPGTSPLDPQNLFKGCYRDVVPDQYCKEKPPSINFRVEVIDDADVVNDKDADLGRFSPADLENCTKAVMDDCYCTAATVWNSTCYKKRAPLLTARKNHNSTDGRKLLIKVGMDTNKRHNRRKSFPSKVLLRVGLSISTTLALLFSFIAIYCFRVVRQYRKKNSHMNASVAEINLQEFTLLELHEATNGFTDKLGQGSCGTVYRGTLSSKDRKIGIAVKQLQSMTEKGDTEFVTELRVIGRTHHKNLVRLLGFCIKDSNRILVYELMENGTLSDFLFKEGERPRWDLRVEIALGVARGLLYLHEGCDSQIIHCDIKPQNVLLDENYTAKIADFGMAKLLMHNQTRTNTNARGTIGYIAPEWLKNIPVTPKVDIFSFGVMLLEIICCRRHIELSRVEEETDEEDLLLIVWVASCVRGGNLEALASHETEVLDDLKRFEKMAMVGLWCVHPDPILRPSIKKVTQMLEGMIEVGVPPLLH